MSKKKTAIIIAICVIAIALIIPQFMSSDKLKVSKHIFALDTTCNIDAYFKNRSEGEKIVDETLNLCKKYEDMLSRTVKGSDVYKINHARGSKVEVSEETATIIKAALELSEESGGQFDITIGRLTDLWNFSAENPQVPNPEDIKKLLPTVGYEKVHVDGQTVWIDDPETWIDLGAIAKGYIADKLSEHLVQKGVKHGIVNLGGNIVCIGKKPDRKLWNIGIEMPGSNNQEIVGSVEMMDQTLVTSGTYERFIEKGNKRYHHILDPKTGWPCKTDVQGVSILGDEGKSMYCDAYSTICLLKGEKDALKFMADHDEYGILTVKNNEVSAIGGSWPK